MSQNFLGDEIQKRHGHLNFSDGFRFGAGLFVAVVFGAVILSGLSIIALQYWPFR